MNLIAELRRYFHNEADKISTSEGWNLIPKHWKSGNPRERDDVSINMGWRKFPVSNSEWFPCAVANLKRHQMKGFSG